MLIVMHCFVNVNALMHSIVVVDAHTGVTIGFQPCESDCRDILKRAWSSMCSFAATSMDEDAIAKAKGHFNKHSSK